MQGRIHIIKQVFQGNRLLTNKIKFMLMGTIAGAVHLILFAFLLGFQVWPFVHYNAVIALVYGAVTYASVKTEKYEIMYYFTVVEVMIHSVLASYFLGIDKGFLTYMLAYIPGSYYMEYSLVEKRDGIRVATFEAVVISICYTAASCVSGSNAPMFAAAFGDRGQKIFYLYNVVSGLLFLLLFSFLFALEIRYANILLQEENSKLGIAANQDALTGVLNRRGMSNSLKGIIEEAEAKDEALDFCLIMADIDHFKQVNDTYGHDVGDVVLKEIATILRENIREADMVSRWGGEEFLLMIRSGVDTAAQIAERIRQMVEDKTIETKGVSIKVRITMGIAEYQKGMQFRTMVDLADQKLYYGKNHGRNQIVK